jgi:hypothetical protein
LAALKHHVSRLNRHWASSKVVKVDRSLSAHRRCSVNPFTNIKLPLMHCSEIATYVVDNLRTKSLKYTLFDLLCYHKAENESIKLCVA